MPTNSKPAVIRLDAAFIPVTPPECFAVLPGFRLMSQFAERARWNIIAGFEVVLK